MEGAISKIAFIYPGQGSQHVGMGKDLYDNLEEARALYHQANEILGFDLARVSFEGPEEELKQTRVTQPAIFVHSLVLTHFLFAREVKPAMTAGHSLGEYSALCAAGALSFDNALRLVKTRAELMQKAGELQKGTMAAIIGLDPDVVTRVCDEASAAGVVQVANYNSPGQIVISGSVDGVSRAMALARERRAKKVIPLVVSGAFHSPLMEHALEGLKRALAEVEVKPAEVPVYSNVTAQPVTEPQEIRRLLVEQLTSPVRWIGLTQKMIEDGAEMFYEVGPGKVLTGLLKRIDRSVAGKAFNGFEAINDLD